MADPLFDSTTLQRRLLDGRNADGGWGYYAAKASRLEPTCWALLALRSADPSVLARWPSADGRLLERSGGEVNYAFHALALLTLTARGAQHTAGTARLAEALQNAKGLAIKDSTINRQDNKLQGWSWIDGTFSWVEPTAWGLLALRKLAATGHHVERARMDDAEAVLVDRCCENGGWNYGNSNMLGKELRPYVPTTAIALMALQKPQKERSIAVVSKSLDYLQRAAASEPSGMAIALASLALRVHARPSDAAPLAGQISRTVELGNQLGMSMSLLALESHGERGEPGQHDEVPFAL